MICGNCGREIRKGAIFCQNCGAPVEISKATEASPSNEGKKADLFCAQCGNPQDGSEMFCAQCGTPLRKPETVTEPTAGASPKTAAPVVSYCAQCGNILRTGMSFCAECGSPVSPHMPIQNIRNSAYVPQFTVRKKNKGLIIALATGIPVIAAAVLLVFLFTAPKSTQAVLGPAGGSIKLEGAEISMASGAAGGSVDMTLTEDKSAGDALPGAGAATYTLMENGSGEEPINVKLKLQGNADKDNLYLCVGAKTTTSAGEEYISYQYIDAQIKDGYLYATFKPSDYFDVSAKKEQVETQMPSAGKAGMILLSAMANAPDTAVSQDTMKLMIITVGAARLYQSDKGHFKMIVPADNGVPYLTEAQAEDTLASFERQYQYFMDIGYTYSLRPAESPAKDSAGSTGDKMNNKPVQNWPFKVMITNTKDSGGYLEKTSVVDLDSKGLVIPSNLFVSRAPETGYIELSRNDYAEQGAKADIHDTIAHEWFHFVQANYTAKSLKSKRWFDEATATFFGTLEGKKVSPNTANEDFFRNYKILFPVMKSENIANNLFFSALKENSKEGYARSPLINYLSTLYAKSKGTTDDPAHKYDFILRCYEKVRDGPNAESAMKEIMQPIGDWTPLALGYYRYLVTGLAFDESFGLKPDVFAQYAPYGPNDYIRDAKLYPDFVSIMDIDTISPADAETIKAGKPLQVGKASVVLNDTVKLLALNMDQQFASALPDGVDLVIHNLAAPTYAYVICQPRTKEKMTVIEAGSNGTIRIPDIKNALKTPKGYLLAISDSSQKKSSVNVTVTLEAKPSKKWVLTGEPEIQDNVARDDPGSTDVQVALNKDSAVYKVTHLNIEKQVMGSTIAAYTFTPPPQEIVPGQDTNFNISGQYTGKGTNYDVTFAIGSPDFADVSINGLWSISLQLDSSNTPSGNIQKTLNFPAYDDDVVLSTWKNQARLVYWIHGPINDIQITYHYTYQ